MKGGVISACYTSCGILVTFHLWTFYVLHTINYIIHIPSQCLFASTLTTNPNPSSTGHFIFDEAKDPAVLKTRGQKPSNSRFMAVVVAFLAALSSYLYRVYVSSIYMRVVYEELGKIGKK